METKEFLSYFPGFCIQTFDDSTGVKDRSLTTCGKPSKYTKERIKELNDAGAGIYFTPNSFPSGERKATLCTKVNAWIMESDDLTIEQQWENLDKSPIKPSFIISSKKSLHAYWLSKDGTIENYTKIVKGLIKHFKGDEACKDISRVFRIPGFYHKKDRDNPYLIELIESNATYHTEEEMLKAFPFEEKKHDFIKIDNKIDLWDLIGSLDNRMMLERLSGQQIVNGETISFSKRSPIGEYILVDGVQCDGWLDEKGMIGSGKRGGPTWIQWLGYYGKTKREIIEWAKSNIPECKNLENGKLLRMPEIKNNYPLRYTWGTKNLDKSFAIIKRPNFIIIAAKRSSGKTTFSFDMACKNAIAGHKVLYISLEMDEELIKDDFGRKYAGITIEEEFEYKIPEHKQNAYKRKIKEIEDIKNLYIRGVRRGGGADWNDILEIISSYDELDLIYIDNLDLINGEKAEQDIERQKRIVKNIMGFTSERKIPIVLIHHYRKSSGKDNGMDEMTGSGKIADGADIIIKIGRTQDADAVYPEKYRSNIYTQKSRGYPEAARSIYFIKGTFVDEAPEETTEINLEDINNYL